MKKCLKCDSDGPFNKNKTKKDGMSSYCRDCDRTRIRAAGKLRTERGRLVKLKLSPERIADLQNMAKGSARKVGHPDMWLDIVAVYIDKLSRDASPNTHSIAVDLMRERYGQPGKHKEASLIAIRAVSNPQGLTELTNNISADVKEKSQMDLLSEMLVYREQLGERRWLIFVLCTIFEFPNEIAAILFGVSVSGIYQTIKSAGEFIKKEGYEFQK